MFERFNPSKELRSCVGKVVHDCVPGPVCEMNIRAARKHARGALTATIDIQSRRRLYVSAVTRRGMLQAWLLVI
jgi:hypothetical protein